MFSTVLVSMLCISILFAAGNGTGPALTAAALEGAEAAVKLCLGTGGVLCLWSGVLEVLRRSGGLRLLGRLLRPLLTRIFPSARRDPALLEDISANFSANLLGLGNAATPPGISAAKRLAARGAPGVAGAELCRLVVLNSASIQLLPTTVAALMAAAGSADPFAILPAVWITSLCSVTAGLLMARLLGGRA